MSRPEFRPGPDALLGEATKFLDATAPPPAVAAPPDPARADAAGEARQRHDLESSPVAPAGTAGGFDDWSPRSITEGLDPQLPLSAPELLGWVYPGKMHLISGRPETGKTWFVLTAIVAAVRADGAALFIDADVNGQREIAARLASLGLCWEEITAVGYTDDVHEYFADESGRRGLAEWVRRNAERGPVVVVIDSLNAAIAALRYSLDEAGVTAFENVVVNPLKSAGAAVILVDHIPMSGDERSPYTISSQRKHAASDVHVRVKSVSASLTRGGPPVAHDLLLMKCRPGGIDSHGPTRFMGRITLTPGEDGAMGWGLVLGPPKAKESPGPAVAVRPRVVMQRVSEWAHGQPESFSKNEAEKAVTGKAETKRSAIDILLDEGYLSHSEEGYRYVRAYRAEEDRESDDGPPRPEVDGGMSSRSSQDDGGRRGV